MAHDMIEEKRQNAEFEFDFTLTKQFCMKTFNSFRPSLNAKEVEKFEKMYSKFADPKAVQDISKQKQTLNWKHRETVRENAFVVEYYNNVCVDFSF